MFLRNLCWANARKSGPYIPARYFRLNRLEKLESTELHTLHPDRLQESDHVNLSSRLRFLILVAGIPSEQATYFTYCTNEKGVKAIFPPRSAGFFYYHRPKDLPFTAGAIRFRIAAVSLRTFATGRDLTRLDGAPWEVPLPTLSKSRPALRELLLRDRLVTKAEIEQCMLMFPGRHARAATALLHRFNDPFPVSFDGANYIQTVCGGEKRRCDVRVFHEQRVGPPSSVYPYSGRALVRFELSTLPEHAGSRVAVLRVVKLIDPPKLRIPNYDGYLPPPVEGELVQRPRRSRGLGVVPWTRKLDTKIGEALARLLDAGLPPPAEDELVPRPRKPQGVGVLPRTRKLGTKGAPRPNVP
ncbi:hypothetical protein B0H17DRAFT_1065888 [Mycena rosella]|uniref:Uncharacterized protein n=1 Tax=Mycena rosella TaxID=1033263 RepID=A0AAD7DEH8_MYCRO|nr:hypothetical protein B0H17DRAFT_1065888 [Mycena rosella]